MYLMATATDHWQATKYKVHVHWIAVSAGDKHEDNALIEDLYRYTSSHSGLWRGCGTVNGKKLCAVLKIDQGRGLSDYLFSIVGVKKAYVGAKITYLGAQRACYRCKNNYVDTKIKSCWYQNDVL